MSADDDGIDYSIVVNHEDQYSIWPSDRELPPSWHKEGTSGSKRECLDQIERLWTDMRPLSLRKQIDEVTAQDAPLAAAAPAGARGESLVARLSRGEHPIVAVLPADGGVAELRRRLESGHLLVRFTETRGGGTELHLRFDPTAGDLASSAFEIGSGTLKVAADLTLDYVPVRCIVEIDLESLAGHGRLKILANGA